MNAAFGLAASAPAAGALVLAGAHAARARHAADRGKALGDHRMARQASLLDIGEDVRRAPADQRIDLHPLALGFEQGQAGAGRALEALSSGDPGVVARKRLAERADLPDLAAPIGVAGEQK